MAAAWEQRDSPERQESAHGAAQISLKPPLGSAMTDVKKCDEACGCPVPCPGGNVCSCPATAGAQTRHETCACGEHCTCNPCACGRTAIGEPAGKGTCTCGAGCSCATCAA